MEKHLRLHEPQFDAAARSLTRVRHVCTAPAMPVGMDGRPCASAGLEASGDLQIMREGIVQALGDFNIAGTDAAAITVRTLDQLSRKFGGITVYFRAVNSGRMPKKARLGMQSRLGIEFMELMGEVIAYEVGITMGLSNIDAVDVADKVKKAVSILFSGMPFYMPKAQRDSRTAALLEQVQQMDRQGKTRHEIAVQLNVSTQYVYSLLRRIRSQKALAK